VGDEARAVPGLLFVQSRARVGIMPLRSSSGSRRKGAKAMSEHANTEEIRIKAFSKPGRMRFAGTMFPGSSLITSQTS
jgi:hypothetical protein